VKRQNHSRRRRDPVFYNFELLRERLKDAGFNSPYALAKHLDLNEETTYKVFNGKGTYKHVRPIADFFKVNWVELHDV